MTGHPEHQQAALRELIEEGLPPEEIAFMMNTSLHTVEAEIARIRQGSSVNTTDEKPPVKDEEGPSR
jgi:DNA-directed RNA polymerase specialized sigma24 family protein